MLCSDDVTTYQIGTFSVLVIITSTFKWQECRPEHVGEDTADKIELGYRSAFCWLFVYFG